MMRDHDSFLPDLTAMSGSDWLGALRQLGEAHGFYEQLGAAHAAVFVERGDTLLVSFESIPSVEAQSDRRLPLGFDMVDKHGWSAVAILSTGDTWFRHPKVYDVFDQMTDDGFFDDFDTVVFYGAGPGGYAAAAFSVAAPGARVLALQPQATLDPRVTEWDDRFTDQRRRDFTSRYGFAPAMVDGALATHVLYDPRERLDAMHAALFEREGVTRHRLPFMGGALQGDLQALGILEPLLIAVAEDRLDRLTMARLMRARRDHPPYLRRLLARLEAEGRMTLVRMLCENVTARLHAPRFQRRLAQLQAGDD